VYTNVLVVCGGVEHRIEFEGLAQPKSTTVDRWTQPRKLSNYLKIAVWEQRYDKDLSVSQWIDTEICAYKAM
jgi:hypothetical protein